ncbi:MAG TPA: hypothetical protein VGM02_16090 [Acidobacteriaceae bacterium]|jgi:hypothetical protein
MHDNFCRVHKTARLTSAMEAGLADHIWTVGEFGPTAGTRKALGVKQVSKVELRRQAIRKASMAILEQMVSGEIEVYIGYRLLYAHWCWNNAALQELRPMFRIPNVSPDGVLSVTEDFNVQVVSLAREILAHFSN